MAIPKYYEMYRSFLECLSDGEIHTIKEVKQKVINDFQITSEELMELLPSGRQAIFDNRIGWCSTYLKKAELIDSPFRAQFRITAEGRSLLQEGIVINDDVLMRYPAFVIFKRGGEKISDVNITENVDTNVSENETPQEALDRVYGVVNSQLADELLSFVMGQSPEFFETLVVKLLEKMGYGGAIKNAGIVTQSSRDEGIDGIINEDKLGFDQIYIQAKKWDIRQTVGRPEIQKFVGALAGQGAAKGVFITTAHFSKEAIEYARRQHTTKVILIDGAKLTDLMIEYDLGVTTVYTYKIKKIDSDFFVEE